MPIFEYQATDKSGTAVRGTLFAESLEKAAGALAEKGFTVSQLGAAQGSGNPIEAPRNITEPRSAVQTQVVGPLVGQVPLENLLFFFRQLSTMLHAGIGIVQSLDTLSKQTRNGKLQHCVAEMKIHAQEGRPLSAGMQRYPEVFNPLVISLVRAGEEGGVLDETLKQVADYMEREIALRNLVRRVTIYPKLVIGASIFIILVTNGLLSMLGKEDRLSSPLTNPATWICLAPFLVLAFLFFRVGIHNPRIRHNYDAVLLKIPGLGSTLHQLAMAKFGRAFAALYKGGVPIHRATALAADACGSQYIRAKIYNELPAFEEGVGVTETFVRTNVFNPIVLDMVRTGETTGNLDQMLTKVGEYFEDEAETQSNQHAMIFGVVCLLAVAVYVGYIVINFYGGYFSKLQSV